MVSPSSACSGTALVQCILTSKGASEPPPCSPKSCTLQWVSNGVWADRLTRAVSWQIVTQLAVGKEAVLAQEVGTLLSGLAPQGEVREPRFCGGTGFAEAWLETMCDRDLLVWAARGPLLLIPPLWGFDPLLTPGTASGADRTLLPKALSPSLFSCGTNCPSAPTGAVSGGPSVRSVSAPSSQEVSPSPHLQCTAHPLPTQIGSSVLVGEGTGISWICGIPAKMPVAPNGSAHSPGTAENQTKPKHPLHPSPILTLLTSSTVLGLTGSRAGCRQRRGLMLSPCLQCACSWRRAAWAGSTGGRTWPCCCSAWPAPCAGCCGASLRPAPRGATWSSR